MISWHIKFSKNEKPEKNQYCRCGIAQTIGIFFFLAQAFIGRSTTPVRVCTSREANACFSCRCLARGSCFDSATLRSIGYRMRSRARYQRIAAQERIHWFLGTANYIEHPADYLRARCAYI